MFLGWIAVEWRFVRARRAFDKQAREDGGGYAFPVEFSIMANWPDTVPEQEWKAKGQPTVPIWRRWLGDEPFGLVVVPSNWSQDEARRAADLFPEGFVFWKNNYVKAGSRSLTQ